MLERPFAWFIRAPGVLFQNRDRGRFDLFGVPVEEALQKTNSTIENIVRRVPVSLSRTQMDGKLPTKLQGITVKGVVLFSEGHVFKALGGSSVPF
jgi:hypothetical protein